MTNDVRLLENYVGGRWVAAKGAKDLPVLNPATGNAIARVPLSGTADVDLAVEAARAALSGWSATPVIERSHYLFALREALRERVEDLAQSVTAEMGKTIADARAEVGRMIEMVECAAAVPTTMQGRVLQGVGTGVDCETIREPVGVCAAIVPFNFPAMVPFWFLPFAIATGNTFVLKPSEQVPLTQSMAFETIAEIGLPPGVVNLVNGDGTVASALIEHPDVDAISFVGSAPVARSIYERSAAAGKRVQALGGAKNHMVVMPDAVVEPTVRAILGSAFGAAGQRCMAGSVLVVVGSAADSVLPVLGKAASAVVVGDPADESVELGPVVSEAAATRIGLAIDKAEQDGAKVLVDGRKQEGSTFVGPTILDHVESHHSVAHDEVFGPVLSVIRVDDLDTAIEVINAGEFGNGCSLFTESAAIVRHFRTLVQVGMIGVNIGVAAPVAFFPFSGWKGSFFGDLHAHGGDAIEFYTRKKTITSRFFSGAKQGRFFVEPD